MTAYKFAAEVTVSAYTIVEADTLEEAMRQAEEREAVIGGLHSGEQADESWIIETADGLATNIRLEDEHLTHNA